MKDLEIRTVHEILLGLSYHENEVGGAYSIYGGNECIQNFSSEPCMEDNHVAGEAFRKNVCTSCREVDFDLLLLKCPHLRGPYITVQIYFIPDLYCPSFKQAVFAS